MEGVVQRAKVHANEAVVADAFSTSSEIESRVLKHKNDALLDEAFKIPTPASKTLTQSPRP